MAGRPLPRRLRPAPRLVPVLAAGELRHARPRALRRGADPRLHARREGPEDVEVARQHHRAPGGHATRAAPTSCGCGWSAPTTPRTSASARDPEAPRRRLSPAAQHAALPAGQPRRLHARPRRSAAPSMPELERWVLHRLAELDAMVRRRSTTSTSTRSSPSCTTSARSISRPSTSTSARTRSTATRPTALRRRAARTVMDEVF